MLVIMLVVYVYGNTKDVLFNWASQFTKRRQALTIREGYYSKDTLETDFHRSPIDALIIEINQLEDHLAFESFKNSIENKYFVAKLTTGDKIGFNPRYIVIYNEEKAEKKEITKYLYENLRDYINIEYSLANKSFIR